MVHKTTLLGNEASYLKDVDILQPNGDKRLKQRHSSVGHFDACVCFFLVDNLLVSLL